MSIEIVKSTDDRLMAGTNELTFAQLEKADVLLWDYKGLYGMIRPAILASAKQQHEDSMKHLNHKDPVHPIIFTWKNVEVLDYPTKQAYENLRRLNATRDEW
jgi:hypothetical protein